MTIRVLPAVGDPGAAQALTGLLAGVPDTEPALAVPDSTALLDTLARLAADALDELPEVVLVHERVGPVPALDLIRDIVLRFPAVGVILVTSDTSTGVLTAAMDSGARGIIGLPLTFDALAERVQAAAAWAAGMRRHLASGTDTLAGPGGSVLAVSGAKGGVGTTLTAVQLALAARSGGRSVALLDLDLQSGDVASYLDVQFRRSVADLAGIADITPRVLQEALFTHETGIALLLAPAEGERGEEITDRVARQVLSALRARHDLVVVDCGSQMSSANAAAVEVAEQALLLVTPDVVAVRAAKRMVRMWDRLQIRKAEETVTVLNRHTRSSEIQSALVERVTGTRVARSTVPAHFRELQSAVDAGRLQDLDARSSVKQALWQLAGELGLAGPETADGGSRRRRASGDRGALGLRARFGGDRSGGAGASGSGGSAGPGGFGGPGGAGGSGGEGFRSRSRSRGGAGRGDGDGRGDGSGGDGARGEAGFRGDRGAVTLEFAAMFPLVLVVLTILWQCALYGYTFSLTGNAADEAARAATAAAAVGDDVQGACARAARGHLPSAWQSASVSCTDEGAVWKAHVRAKVPLFLPGFDADWHVSAEAGAATEGDG